MLFATCSFWPARRRDVIGVREVRRPSTSSRLKAHQALSALAQFALQTGTAFGQPMSEDRKRFVNPPPRVPRLPEWSAQGVHATWIGDSIVLIRLDAPAQGVSSGDRRAE
jgi:hypothetical protein